LPPPGRYPPQARHCLINSRPRFFAKYAVWSDLDGGSSAGHAGRGVGILGREVSRDVIGALRDKNMITAGPRSPTAGVPFTYVRTKGFWSISGSTH
jgi:hypothetical protein